MTTLSFASRFIGLVLTVFISLSFPSGAQTISVSGLDGRIDLGRQIWIAGAVDPDTTIDDILSPNSDIVFHQSRETVPQYTGRDGDVWLKADLLNSGSDDLRGNLVIRFPYLEVVDAYIVDAKGHMITGRAGAAVARSGLAIPHPFPAFEIDVPANETRTLFVRVHSDTVVVLPVFLHSSADFQSWSQWSTAIYAAMIGIILTFTAYAFSIARDSQNVANRLYFCFCAAATLYVIFSAGVGKSFLWPQSDFSTISLIYALQGAVTAFAALFIGSFLDVRERWPAFHTVINVIVGLAVFCSFNAFLPIAVSRFAYMAASGAGPLVMLAGVWVLYRRGVYGAGAVLLAWTPLILATVWMYLRILNITPYFEVNHYLLPMALCVTVLQFSWAISNRVRDAESNAATDPLTGLGNRRQLNATIASLGRRSSSSCAAVLAIDLDGFKAINDTHGHAAGDAVLKVVADRLKLLGFGRAKVFRTGGDEFIVLYSPRDGRAEIRSFGDQCIARICLPIYYRSLELRVGASVGLAFVADNQPLDIAIPNADAALYNAKRDGKGVVRIFEQRQPAAGSDRFVPIVVNA